MQGTTSTGSPQDPLSDRSSGPPLTPVELPDPKIDNQYQFEITITAISVTATGIVGIIYRHYYT